MRPSREQSSGHLEPGHEAVPPPAGKLAQVTVTLPHDSSVGDMRSWGRPHVGDV